MTTFWPQIRVCGGPFFRPPRRAAAGGVGDWPRRAGIGATRKVNRTAGEHQGFVLFQVPSARHLHPTDEDLSVGTPDLGHPSLVGNSLRSPGTRATSPLAYRSSCCRGQTHLFTANLPWCICGTAYPAGDCKRVSRRSPSRESSLLPMAKRRVWWLKRRFSCGCLTYFALGFS